MVIYRTENKKQVVVLRTLSASLPGVLFNLLHCGSFLLIPTHPVSGSTRSHTRRSRASALTRSHIRHTRAGGYEVPRRDNIIHINPHKPWNLKTLVIASKQRTTWQSSQMYSFKKNPQGFNLGVFYYFFLRFVCGFALTTFAGTVFLYSLYSIDPQVYANTADTAAIKPGINPSEKYTKNTTATTKTIV